MWSPGEPHSLPAAYLDELESGRGPQSLADHLDTQAGDEHRDEHPGRATLDRSPIDEGYHVGRATVVEPHLVWRPECTRQHRHRHLSQIDAATQVEWPGRVGNGQHVHDTDTADAEHVGIGTMCPPQVIAAFADPDGLARCLGSRCSPPDPVGHHPVPGRLGCLAGRCLGIKYRFPLSWAPWFTFWEPASAGCHSPGRETPSGIGREDGAVCRIEK